MVKTVALLIMLEDYLSFVCWPGGGVFQKIIPSKCNNKIDLQFLNIEKFRNCKCLLNVTALVPRFINNLKKRLNQEEKVVQRYVTTEEYSKAEHLWLVFIQHDVMKICQIETT